MLTVINSTFSSSSTPYGGAGIESSGDTPNLTDSTFSGNSSIGGDGGRILNYGSATLTNAIIANSPSSANWPNQNGATLTAYGSNIYGDNASGGATMATSAQINSRYLP